MSSCRMTKAWRMVAAPLLGSSLLIYAQTPEFPHPEPVFGAAAILFAASPVPEGTADDGTPALPTIDPIAFVSGGKLLECINWKSDGDTVPVPTLNLLRKAYASGRVYPLWSRGERVGKVVTEHSCIGEEDIAQGGTVDLQGCVRYRFTGNKQWQANGAWGTVWTGKTSTATHKSVSGKPSEAEMRQFVDQAVRLYMTGGVSASASQVRVKSIAKTQLRKGQFALIGSTMLQAPSQEKFTWNSDRLFLAVEIDKGRLLPVLVVRHHAQVQFRPDDDSPNPGEELDEENNTDEESFVDNFPLFPGEPDAVITRHQHYESWDYSIYRWSGSQYNKIYTGCGGGT